MKLTSPAFENGGVIPEEYTCEGEDVSPELVFSDIPANTVTLALIMDDPDVPPEVRADRMWDHWVVFNMPPDTKGIPRGVAPAGILGSNTSGTQQYQGPCPPDREHRYYFKLYALDKELDLPAGALKVQVEQAMHDHVLAHSELMGTYCKKNM